MLDFLAGKHKKQSTLIQVYIFFVLLYIFFQLCKVTSGANIVFYCYNFLFFK